MNKRSIMPLVAATVCLVASPVWALLIPQQPVLSDSHPGINVPLDSDLEAVSWGSRTSGDAADFDFPGSGAEPANPPSPNTAQVIYNVTNKNSATQASIDDWIISLDHTRDTGNDYQVIEARSGNQNLFWITMAPNGIASIDSDISGVNLFDINLGANTRNLLFMYDSANEQIQMFVDEANPSIGVAILTGIPAGNPLDAIRIKGGGFPMTNTPNWDNLVAGVFPEPGSLALLGIGGMTLLARRRA